MAETIIKSEMELSSQTLTEGQQLITVQTPSDDQQLIMVTFAGPDVPNTSEGEVYVPTSHDTIIAGSVGQLMDNSTQTETVFGLEDLPTVTEIVRKTIAKTKKQQQENERASAANDVQSGPVNGIYTCSLCAKVYRNKISWQNHLLTHNGSEVFMCGVCGQLFIIRNMLKAHLDVHIREERKMRRTRNMVYSSADMKIGGVYMPGDIVPKDDDNVAKSDFAETVGNIDDNQHSYVAATEEVSNDADIAQELLPEPKEKQQISSTGAENETESNFIYACNICGEQYTVKEDCEKHLKIHTGIQTPGDVESDDNSNDSPSSPSPFIPGSKVSYDNKAMATNRPKYSTYIYACNVCGKQYTNKSNCKRHMRIHTEEDKNFECEYCGKRFAQKYEVKMHSRIHTGEKPYTCAVCGKTFTERGNWRRHTQIHVRPQEASPYRCGICCKGFFHAEKLQVHLQIHSGQRPFICTVCGRKVKKIGDMYRHLRTHTGEKPYKCQVCSKGFAQNGNLKDHMKMHTGEKPHICDLCGKDFARKVLLKEHVKNHHKGTTLKDLTEAALEEIERQEAAMESVDGTDSNLEAAVVHEISAGSVSKLVGGSKTIVMGGPSVPSVDEEELLHEEQELELQEEHSSLTQKELEAAQVLTVVQEGDGIVYAYTDSNQQQQVLMKAESGEHIIVSSNGTVVNSDGMPPQHFMVQKEDGTFVMDGVEFEVQNS